MKIRSVIVAGFRWVEFCLPQAFAVSLLALVFLSATPAHAAERQLLQSSHVPPVVKELLPVGRLTTSQNLRLAIGLPLRNPTALTNLILQIYDPASPNYRRYLTPKQFTEMFGPTEQDYQAVITFAQANGLRVTAHHPNRMLLDVAGSVPDIEKAFQVAMHVYQHPAEARTFFAPDVEPSVPSGLRILDVSGLNDYIRPHPKYRLKQGHPVPAVTPKVGSGPAGNYLGNDFRAAYVPGVSLTGVGQTVGLLQFDGYYPNDITAYESLAGLPNVPLENVLLDGYDGIPTGTGGEVEVSLDIEMVISMAPGLSKVIVYMAGPSGIPNDILNRMATDNSASQLSCSWGWSGGPDATTEQIFQQMAAQGQTFFNASGDSDAFLNGQVDDPTYPGSPASSPNITQVGGTTLTTSGPGGDWVSETVWNWGNKFGASYDGIGSSGGISSYYRIPSWQQNIDMTANKGSITFRNIPDVAMTADDVYVIADNGTAYPGTSGTSVAAPLWAGFTALVNQQAAQNGIPPVGFINPAIYTIGKGPSTSFHDIVTGDNTWSQSPTLFFAVAGYDLCTGWGTPNGIDLITALAGAPPRNGFLQIGVNPPSGSALLGSTDQPIFVRVTDVFGVTNATVTATIAGITNLTFLNNGQSPDSVSNDYIYSALFQVPSSSTALTMTVTATATDEIGVTNTIFYSIVPPPPNDYFTNATKVPGGGATYPSNNRIATIEQGEPQHGGDTNVAASLWWVWSPTNSTNVLIDTTGSLIDTVLAVYRGDSLTNLNQVAATNNVGQQKQAYLKFNASAGTAYHIAVASVDTNSVGPVQLRIAPGGQLDATPPEVRIVNPPSGLRVANRLISIFGTSFDPTPNASGVRENLVNINGIISSSAVGTTNWTTRLALKQGINVIQVRALDAAGNFSSTATVQVDYLPLDPPNDLFANAIKLTGPSGTSIVNNTNATKEFGEPNHAGDPGGKSVWWSFHAPSDGVLFLTTSNSTFDTVLGLYQGSRVTNLTTIASNDDALDGVTFSKISQAVRANEDYRIAVDGVGGSAGQVNLTYVFATNPVYFLTVNAAAGGSVSPGSGFYANGSTVAFTATPEPNYEFVNWEGGVTSTANPLAVVVNGEMSLTARFRAHEFTDGFESGGLSVLPWVTSGNKPWLVQSDVVSLGRFAARSGAIGDNQFSSLDLTNLTAAGVAVFDYKVSSEASWDWLEFHLNGLLLQRWSGEVGWATYQFSVPAGTNVFQWRYAKDAIGSAGSDAAFIDNLDLPQIATSLRLLNPTFGGFQLEFQGRSAQSVRIQGSTNLASWQDLKTNVLSNGDVIQFADPQAANYPFYRFYRAVSP